MKKVSKILLFVGIFILALVFRAEKSHAAEYIWPVVGDNAYETYKDYDFYGKAYAAPYKDGKSGREYVVNSTLWPEEQSFQSGEPGCNEILKMRIHRQKAEEETVQTAVDHQNQCGCQNERHLLQQDDERPEEGRHRNQQKDAGRHGGLRCRRLQGIS